MPRKNRIRDRRDYDDKRPIVAALRPIHTNDTVIHKGEVIDHKITEEPFRRRLWASGRAEYKDEYQPVDVAPKADEKEDLIAKIKELGGKATKSMRVETLQAKLADLVAAADADGSGSEDDDTDVEETAEQVDETANNAETGADEVDTAETQTVDETDVGDVEDVLNPASDLAENADAAQDDAEGA